MATEFEIIDSGDSVTINDVIFQDSDNVNSGTGNYNTFLALHDNDGDEAGFNADSNDPSNPDINAAKTRTIQLHDLAVVMVGGIPCYEFRIDLNEVKSGDSELISLDQFQIYTSGNGGLATLTDVQNANPIYDLDDGVDRTVLLKQDSNGGGTDDYSVYVPVSLFSGVDADDYVYLYVQFGATDGYEADDGFEEIRALLNPDIDNPAINVTKSVDSIDDGDDFGGSGQADSAGDVINYTITIENTGNVPLTGVTVDDQVEAYSSTPADPVLNIDGYNIGDANENDILDVGEIWSYTSSYTLAQDDLDNAGYGTPAGDLPGDGLLNNLATGNTNETEEDTDNAVVPLVYSPSILVTKSVDSIDDDEDFGGSGQADSAGDTINYLITIANTGNISLTGVTVTDNVEGFGATNATYDSGDDNTNNILDVGETWTFTASYVLTQDDIDNAGYGTPAGDLPGDGFLDNVATGDTGQTDGDTSAAQVPLVYAPSVDLEKLVSVDGGVSYADADSPTGPAAVDVDTIYFKFVITNDGNTTLTGVTLADSDFDFGLGVGVAVAIEDLSNSDLETDGELAPGESFEFILTAPFEVGQHTDTGTADTDQEVTDSDDANYFGIEGPGVRTPGFWQSKFGSQFWNGTGSDEAKAGQHCFPDGELIKLVDSDGNGSTDKLGLLIGDYSGDGLTNFGETTLFIDLDAAKKLISANEKDVQDGRWMLGRDVVATWLNFLAGNGICEDENDPNDGIYSAREAIDDAIAWLKLYGDNINHNGILFAGGKPAFEGPAIKTSSAAWQVDGVGFESGSDIHNALDEYNNYGTVGGHICANDADNEIFCNLLATL